MRVAGVDGTKGGWVCIVLDDGRFVRDYLLRPAETDFPELSDAEAIGIDMPIGFGPREVDRAARKFLTGAASAVFAVPSREILETPFRPGLGCSAQSHALGPRIIHVTDLAATDRRLHEVHPEVSFRAMNDREPLRHRKKSWGGVHERIELLRLHGIELEGLGPAATAPVDDVLDAAAAAWSAHRIATNRAQPLPDAPELVAGRQIAIWY